MLDEGSQRVRENDEQAVRKRGKGNRIALTVKTVQSGKERHNIRIFMLQLSLPYASLGPPRESW